MSPLLFPSSSSLLLWLSLLLLLPLLSSSSALPGCPTHCGDLEVPFPFGIGSNCSLDDTFEILCNNSFNPAKAYLPPSSFQTIRTYTSPLVVEVIDVMLNVSQVRVKYPSMGVSCFDDDDDDKYPMQLQHKLVLDPTTFYFSYLDLSGTPFVFSEHNLMTAVGCDDLAYAYGDNSGIVDYTSCMTYCVNSTGINGKGNGSCSTTGNGCCRTHIHPGQTGMGATTSDLHNNLPGPIVLENLTRTSKFYRCSYAFIAENGVQQKQLSSFRLDGLNNMTTFLNQNPELASTPVLLDWRVISAQNCTVAAATNTCKKNSVCIDYDATLGGYLCNCAQGYTGNPYLSVGCQDIDECASEGTNSCEFNCTNTPGSYACSCPNGYEGDGSKHGTGCKSLPRPKIINVSIGVASGLVFLLVLATFFKLYKGFQKRKDRKQRQKFFKKNGGLLLKQQQKNKGTNEHVNLFLANELAKATDNFNENMILGRGGQGTVYKGMLSNGKIVAIKKAKLIDGNLVDMFVNEILILSQINHRNVVKLLGCCLETEVPLLVYEYVPNGTLSARIHDQTAEFPISWSMRLKIAVDTAGALAYMHSASSIPIFHRDIKSSNILLDEKFVAKISDFGTSKLVGMDQTHVTTLVKGTFGYFDPEYFGSCCYTEKSDVYSFGVVLVELLTSQKPVSSNKDEEERNLALRFLLSMRTKSLDKMLDAIVLEQGSKKNINATARLAKRCLNSKGSMRPTMKEVAVELENIRMSE